MGWEEAGYRSELLLHSLASTCRAAATPSFPSASYSMQWYRLRR